MSLLYEPTPRWDASSDMPFMKTSIANKSKCNSDTGFHPFKLPIINTPKMLK